MVPKIVSVPRDLQGERQGSGMKRALTYEGQGSAPSPVGDLLCDFRQIVFPPLTSVSPTFIDIYDGSSGF